MKSTGSVDSWASDPSNLGPIYPFVGWEALMFVVCLALSVAFMVWKLMSEDARYRIRAARLREGDQLSPALGALDSANSSHPTAEQ